MQSSLTFKTVHSIGLDNVSCNIIPTGNVLCATSNRNIDCVVDRPECDDKLRIVDIRPNVPEGCTFVRWVDSSNCAAKAFRPNQLQYSVIISQNCSDKHPLQTIPVHAINKTFMSFNTSQYTFPIHLRVKGDLLNYCQWKSTCHKVDTYGNLGFNSSRHNNNIIA